MPNEISLKKKKSEKISEKNSVKNVWEKKVCQNVWKKKSEKMFVKKNV